MKDSRIDTSPLNFFRFSAVVTVIYIHYGHGIENFNLFPYGITRGGAIITFFYVLSGFGLFLGYQKKDSIDLRSYFIKRTTRILPFYYIALFMMAPILFIAGRFSFTELFLSFFCLQSWLPGYQHSINPPGWFVANLIFFYCVFPIIFAYIKKVNPEPARLLFSSIMLWGFSLILHNSLLSSVPESFYNYIDCFPLSWICSFYMGICGAYFLKSNHAQNRLFSNNSALHTLFILILCSLILIFHHGEVAEKIETALPFEANLYAPIFLLMIIHLSTAKNFITKILSLRFFGLLATISYPLYIFQAPLHTFYNHFISKPMKMQPEANFLTFFIFFVIITHVLTIIENNIFKRIEEKTAKNRA